jgi:hypothetical protein
MGNSALQVGGHGSGLSMAAATTYYFCCGQCNIGSLGAVLVARLVPYRTAGILSNLRVVVATNSINGATTIVTMISVSPGSQTLTVPSSTSGTYEDTTNSDTLSSGDLVAIRAVTGGFSGALVMANTSTIYTATTDACVRHICYLANVSFVTASTTWFLPIVGNYPSLVTTEANVGFVCRTDGVIKNAAVYVVTNSKTVASTVKDRIDLADGTISLSIGAGTTGRIEETAHSDNVTAGQKIDLSITTGASGTALILLYASVEYVTTNGNFSNISQGLGALNADTTYYAPIAGGTVGSTESYMLSKAGVSMNCTNLYAYCTQWSLSAGALTMTLRKNSANGNNTISITGTGEFEDTTHTDSMGSTDLLDLAMVVGGETGTVTLGAHGFMSAMPVSTGYFMDRSRGIFIGVMRGLRG